MSKRNFYEDDTHVVPEPGTVVPAAGTELQALGTLTSVDGASVRTASFLERVFKSLRQETQGAYLKLRSKTDSVYASVNSNERAVTSTMLQLHNKLEDLFPNAVYVIIAGLAGNIAGRRHGIAAKVVYPTVFATAAFAYFLPKTFTNTKNYLWEVEQQKLPAVAAKQKELANLAEDLVNDVEKGADDTKQWLSSTVHGLRQKVADVTGLNIDDVKK